jgi:hypothetical protein
MPVDSGAGAYSQAGAARGDVTAMLPLHLP